MGGYATGITLLSRVEYSNLRPEKPDPDIKESVSKENIPHQYRGNLSKQSDKYRTNPKSPADTPDQSL
jgi:hypothetical protein